MIEALCFLVGLHLTMVLIAGCYRIIDLWYRIDEYLLDISARLFIILMVIALAYYLLNNSFQTAFMLGQAFFTLFHLLIHWLGRLLLKV